MKHIAYLLLVLSVVLTNGLSPIQVLADSEPNYTELSIEDLSDGVLNMFESAGIVLDENSHVWLRSVKVCLEDATDEKKSFEIITERSNGSCETETICFFDQKGLWLEPVLEAENVSGTKSTTYSYTYRQVPAFAIVSSATYDRVVSNFMTYIRPISARIHFVAYTGYVSNSMQYLEVEYRCSGLRLSSSTFTRVDSSDSYNHRIVAYANSPTPSVVYGNYSNALSNSYVIDYLVGGDAHIHDSIITYKYNGYTVSYYANVE